MTKFTALKRFFRKFFASTDVAAKKRNVATVPDEGLRQPGHVASMFY
jgi:hypothetical protein